MVPDNHFGYSSAKNSIISLFTIRNPDVGSVIFAPVSNFINIVKYLIPTRLAPDD